MTGFWVDPLGQYLALVEQTTIDPPAEFKQLLARWDSREEHHGVALQRYTDAVLDGTPGTDLGLLYAAALAEQASTVDQATVRNFAAAQLLHRLRAIITPGAFGMHSTLAARFNDASAKLAKSSAVLEAAGFTLETKASELIGSDQKTRTAWMDGELHASALDLLVLPLAASSALSGRAADAPEEVLPLVIDTAGVNRRTTWECYNQVENRCGRWSALLSAGIPIRARDLPEVEESYRLPMPIRTEYRNGRPVEIDPELASAS